MYTLYHGPGSCSLAVKAALDFIGTDYETHSFQLFEGEHLTEEFKKINPLAKVPVLEINGEYLSEGAAILQYLAIKHPEAGLMPEPGTIQHANALKWIQFLYATIHPNWSRIFFPARFGENTADIKQKAEAELYKLYSVINQQLENHSYIAGDNITLADFYLMVSLHWEKALETPLSAHYPVFEAYKTRIYDNEKIGDAYKAELT